MAAKSLYWYDFETFGVDPRKDRASQFAGVRTDEDLNIIGDPLVMYCKPADDFLPDPIACLITGITPQKAMQEGIVEAEFITRIHAQFTEPATCVVGYNSIRFDDEVTRQLLYRNFFDPYEREWKNGNSRWDIIDMLRLCAATRPDGISWPKKEDGSNSFRLELLTAANGIEHADAHDALADVIATIELAKLIKQQQPKLYDYVFQLRDKKKLHAEIDMATRKPLLHVSMMYPARLGCLALVMPICAHPTNSNGIIVYDLRDDPTNWVELPIEEIRQRVYTPKNKLPPGASRISLKVVHVNKCPIITSPAVLEPARAEAYEIDLERCKQHWEILQANSQVVKKVSAVFQQDQAIKENDPDFMIYSGSFFSDYDRSLMKTVRSTSATDLGRLNLPFRDQRLHELLFRYRARNYPQTLNNDELTEWNQFRQQRLTDQAAHDRFKKALTEARGRAEPQDQPVLDELEVYANDLLRDYGE